MAKLRHKRVPRHRSESLASPQQSAPATSPSSPPPTWLQGLCSLALALHLSALLVALASNLAPSYLQGKLLGLLSPYLVTTHQIYRTVPLELTHAEQLDFPLVFEVLDAEDSQTEWQPLTTAALPPFSAKTMYARNSQWSNFSRWFTLTADQQPEAEILADVSARFVNLAEASTGTRYRAVRAVTAKVNSFDEDLALQLGVASSSDAAYQPRELFRATVVRRENRPLSLVPAQAPLRTSKPHPVAQRSATDLSVARRSVVEMNVARRSAVEMNVARRSVVESPAQAPSSNPTSQNSTAESRATMHQASNGSGAKP